MARWLRTRRWIAALVLLGFGLVMSATLMPTAEALEGRPSDGMCDVGRVGLLPLRHLMYVTPASLNVLLFVPLGLGVALLPPNRRSGFVVLAAISLTFWVETVQLVVTPLGRDCSTADLFDNLLGLAVGAACGLLVRLSVRRLDARRTRNRE